MSHVVRMDVAKGMTSIGIAGKEYKANDKGQVDLPNDADVIEQAKAHGCKVAEKQPVFKEVEETDPGKGGGKSDPGKGDGKGDGSGDGKTDPAADGKGGKK